MSKAAKFVKKNPWETAGAAAALALGGPAVMGMLGGGTAASGIAGAGAGLLGASDMTAALAGDAFLPGALGAAGTGTPGMGSALGAKLAGIKPAGLGKGLLMAGQMGGIGGGGQSAPPMQRPQPSPFAATNTMPQQVSSAPPLDPRDPDYFRKLMQMQQGGYA